MLFLNERLRLSNRRLRELEKEKEDLKLNLGGMINIGEDYNMARRLSRESAKRVLEKKPGKIEREIQQMVQLSGEEEQWLRRPIKVDSESFEQNADTGRRSSVEERYEV